MNIAIVGKVTRSYDQTLSRWTYHGSAYHIIRVLFPYVNPQQLFLIASCNSECGVSLIEDLRPLGIHCYHLPEFGDQDTISSLTSVFQIAKAGFMDMNHLPQAKSILNRFPDVPWIIKPSLEDEKIDAPHSYATKLNRAEAVKICGIPLFDFNDFEMARDVLKRQGIERGFITLSKDGVYYFDQDQQGIIKSKAISKTKFYEAGDAFLAGVLYGLRFTKDVSLLAAQGIDKSAALINELATKRFKGE